MTEPKLRSAFFVPSSPGYIYVEASAEKNIREIFAGLFGVIAQSPIELIPLRDSIALLTHRVGNINVKEGMWVRVKRKGVYYRDLAFVHQVLEPNKRVVIRLIPRFLIVDDQSSKRKQLGANNRAPQQMFNGDIVTELCKILLQQYQRRSEVCLSFLFGLCNFIFTKH